MNISFQINSSLFWINSKEVSQFSLTWKICVRSIAWFTSCAKKKAFRFNVPSWMPINLSVPDWAIFHCSGVSWSIFEMRNFTLNFFRSLLVDLSSRPRNSRGRLAAKFRMLEDETFALWFLKSSENMFCINNPFRPSKIGMIFLRIIFFKNSGTELNQKQTTQIKSR